LSKGNPNYIRGRRLEYDTVDTLRAMGYYTMRSAGSHTVIDIIAWLQGYRLAIQCKSGDSSFGKDDQESLIRASLELEALPVLVTRKNRKTSWQTVTRDGYLPYELKGRS
jgi:Holliday junction resolvase